MLTLKSELENLMENSWKMRYDHRDLCFKNSQNALKQALEEHFFLAEGMAKRNIGYCYFRSGNCELALLNAKQAKQIAQDLLDLNLELDCLQIIFAAYNSIGDLATSIDTVLEIIEINIALNDTPGLIWGLNSMAVVYQQLGESQISIEYADQSINLCQSINDYVRQSAGLNNRGIAKRTLKRYDEAIADFEKALDISRDYDLHDIMAQTLVNLSEVLLELGEYDKALNNLDIAFKLVNINNQKEGFVYCFFNIAKVKLAQNKPFEALNYINSAIKNSEQLNLKTIEYQSYALKSRIHKQIGHFESALDAYEKYHELEKKTINENANQKMRIFTANREAERAKQQAALEQLRAVELSQALTTLENVNQVQSLLLEKLKEKSDHLELIATYDELTGLANRRFFEQHFISYFTQAINNKIPLPLAFLDIDDFKRINDQYGHFTGDTAILRML